MSLVGFSMLGYRKDLKQKARNLRNAATDAEQALWFRLRRKQLAGIQFYRQRPIGDYIVDFYAPKANLVVELDGSQHLTNRNKDKDSKRTAFLREPGLSVLRFDDRQVLNEIEAVLEAVFIGVANSKS
jgi:very-short-patch-repair endonuclease